MIINYTKNILKHSLIYGSGEILIKIVAFLLIPLYTRYLNPDAYGLLQILIITASLVTIFLQFGIGSALFKSVIYHPEGNKKEIYSTAFFFILISSIVFLSIVYMNTKFFSRLLFGGEEQSRAFQILSLTIFFRNLSQITLAKLRIENRSLTFSILLLLQFTLKIGLNIYFIVFAKLGVIGILYADLVTSGLFSIIFICFLASDLQWAFSLSELKDMLEFGLPIVPGNLAMFALNMSNRYFIKHFAGMEAVGLFSLAYQFSMIMYLTIFAFQRAWASLMFEIANEEDSKKIFAKNFTYFFLITGLIALGVSTFAPELIDLFADPKYHQASKIVPFLTLSNFFYGIFFYTAIGINIKKKTYFQTLSVIIGALFCIGLNYVLIPKYGMIGGALANLFSFMIMAFSEFYISNRLYPVPYSLNRILPIGILFVLTYLISTFIHSSHFWIRFTFKAVLICISTFLAVSTIKAARDIIYKRMFKP